MPREFVMVHPDKLVSDRSRLKIPYVGAIKKTTHTFDQARPRKPAATPLCRTRHYFVPRCYSLSRLCCHFPSTVRGYRRRQVQPRQRGMAINALQVFSVGVCVLKHVRVISNALIRALHRFGMPHC